MILLVNYTGPTHEFHKFLAQSSKYFDFFLKDKGEKPIQIH